MPAIETTLKLKNLEIPILIKSYKNSKSVKIYFKGNVLNVTKPKRLAIRNVLEILKENENSILDKYNKITSSEVNTIKQWKTGEKIYYKGIQYSIIRNYEKSNRIKIEIIEEQEQIIINVPETMEQEQIKIYVDKLIKKLFKKDTELLISKKLPYWSKITQINYNMVKVRDATTRYGSCMPNKKNVYFSSRLIMLSEEIIDAIIVHELCHIKYQNHSKQFYELIEKYIPNYKSIDKWLKVNGKLIMF